jgi:hypothetical protein
MALVWLMNGLFCKVLHLVPRHERIVAAILGARYAPELTITIGVLETLMAVWIISGISPRLNAIAQMVVVAAMNLIEFFLVSDLLLFGRWNLMVAGFFIAVIYYWGFVINKKASHVPSH